MTAICYSQLSGFRSPWGELVGGVDKRLADLLGLLLLLLPLPLYSWLWALHVCTLVSASTSFIPFFSCIYLLPRRGEHPIFSYFILFNFLSHLYYHLCSLLFSVKHSFSVEESCCRNSMVGNLVSKN